MPVPTVNITTTPLASRPAPNVISAMPAASASLITVTAAPDSCSETARATDVPIHAGSMFAAVYATPAFTTAGNAHPTGPVYAAFAITSVTTGTTAAGVAGCGVSTRTRSVAS